MLKLTRSYPRPPKGCKEEKVKVEGLKGVKSEKKEKRESQQLEDESESRVSRLLCKHCCFRSKEPLKTR